MFYMLSVHCIVSNPDPQICCSFLNQDLETYWQATFDKIAAEINSILVYCTVICFISINNSLLFCIMFRGDLDLDTKKTNADLFWFVDYGLNDLMNENVFQFSAWYSKALLGSQVQIIRQHKKMCTKLK